MNCLRQPGDSDYDVLGLSPEASEDEIHKAFGRLIDEQEYKIGVPLRSQWARAREIKDAYSRLAEPSQRKAYDQTLGRSSGQTPWAATAKDTATDELVLPEEPREAADRPADNLKPREAAPNHRSMRGPAFGEAPVHQNDEGSFFHHRPPPPYLASVRDDGRQAPARGPSRAAAAAVAGVGLVLISSWAWLSRMPSATEPKPEVTASSRQANIASGPEARPGQVQSNALVPVRTSPSSGSPAASKPPDVTQEVAPNKKILPVTNAANKEATAEPAPADIPPAGPGSEDAPTVTDETVATQQPPAPSVEREAPVASAPPPPPPRAAPTVVPAPVRPVRSVGIVRTPARWLGGGPGYADNPGGRYVGSVAVQVAIGTGGRVTSCAPIRSSGNASLDAITCRLVRERARFSPALDAQGRPVPSQAYTTFVWGSRRRR